MKPRKVLLVGGGTAGSVMPLVALHEEIKEQSNGQTKFVFLGTKKGIEKDIATHNKIAFTEIYAGKFRRYFDVRNIFDPILILLGFFQSIFILNRYKPDVILSAGSFVLVPVAWAAKILRIPLFIHQQDVRKSLSNVLTAFAATKITVSLQQSVRNFPPSKTVYTGNPLREGVTGGSREKAYELFGLRKDLPILLVIGGGTGALKLNEIVNESLSELLSFTQVIHLTGKGKKVSLKKQNYFPFEFLKDELKHVYAAADLVITRAGMSTITELAALKKTTIMVPLPHTHQQDNASFLLENNATIVCDQALMTPQMLVDTVRQIILNPEKKRALGNNLHHLFLPNARKRYVELIENTLNELYVQKHT